MHKELKKSFQEEDFFFFSKTRRPGNQTNRKELLNSGTVSASYSDMSKHINQTSKKACKKIKKKIKKLSNVRISILFTDFKLFAPICLHLLRLGSSICRIHKKRTEFVAKCIRTLGKYSRFMLFFFNKPLK